MLLTVFLFDGIIPPSAPLAAARSKLEALNLLPLTPQDLVNVMTNPFIEKPNTLIEYGNQYMDMSPKAIKELAQEVAVACLEVGSKVRTSFVLLTCRILRPHRGRLSGDWWKASISRRLLPMLPSNDTRSP